MQSDGRASVILLKSPYSRLEEGTVAAGQTIKPGNLIDFNSSGLIINHATAAGTSAARRFATEDMLLYEGKTIADSYAAGSKISYREFLPGDEIQAWLEAGLNAAVGAKLESAGDGSLQALTTGKALVQAIEAVDATAGTKMCNVKIL
jgi:hypothetical protein